MLNPLCFLISRLNIACSPLIFNLQINYPIRIKDIPFKSFQLWSPTNPCPLQPTLLPELLSLFNLLGHIFLVTAIKVKLITVVENESAETKHQSYNYNWAEWVYKNNWFRANLFFQNHQNCQQKKMK